MCTIRVHHQKFFTGMLDLKTKSQLSLKFPFFIQQEYAKNPMKNNKRRKETHSRLPPQSLILRLVIQSVDVHLSLIHKERPGHKANSAKQSEFVNNESKYKKTVGGLFKGKWNELVLSLWLSFLSVVDRRASCMLSHDLTKTVHLFVNTFT